MTALELMAMMLVHMEVAMWSIRALTPSKTASRWTSPSAVCLSLEQLSEVHLRATTT